LLISRDQNTKNLNNLNQIHQIALSKLFGFGPRRIQPLLEAVGNISLIFELTSKELSSISGVSIGQLEKMQRGAALETAAKISENCDKFNIETIFYQHSSYPRRLKQCSDAPIVLYKKGKSLLNEPKIVSIVGTRNMSEYGKRICDDLVRSLSETNCTVISGMAYGVDIAIHRNCIQQGISTIGVMAHGLEMIYPRDHAKAAEQMLEIGALISEFPPFTNPDRENFPMRNRIVAGMADATIVVESQKKGGSLITADLANDYNRDVFAFPGNVYEQNSEGCNQLILNDKAHLLLNGHDFLKKMGWDTAVQKSIQKSFFPELTLEEQRIIDLIQNDSSINVDSVAMQLKMPISQLSVHLFELEMSGILRPIPGNKFQLI
jgi:DNA processing protein